jgi:hypothetical protein
MGDLMMMRMFHGSYPTDARGVLFRGIRCFSGENLMDIGFILPGSWIIP